MKIKNFPVITRSDSDEVISRDSRLTRPDETSGLAMAKKGFAIIGSKNKDVQVKMYRLRAYRTVG
ncbi:MAG TPA: hypothetical protein ENN38_00980 [Actinobacteria bacterium]|nr:hypothetical protein [Actinomycetota bacterium]